jgi:alanine-synthesizing transaminase
MGNPDLPTPQHVVDKLIEAAKLGHNHRYSASRGIPKLREAISNWYKRRYDVDIDPETEAIATIGAKEGLSHLVLATTGEMVLVLIPPIRSMLIRCYCRADLVSIPLDPDRDFEICRQSGLIAPAQDADYSYPIIPTMVVDLDFKKLSLSGERDSCGLILLCRMVFDVGSQPAIPRPKWA